MERPAQECVCGWGSGKQAWWREAGKTDRIERNAERIFGGNMGIAVAFGVGLELYPCQEGG